MDTERAPSRSAAKEIHGHPWSGLRVCDDTRVASTACMAPQRGGGRGVWGRQARAVRGRAGATHLLVQSLARVQTLDGRGAPRATPTARSSSGRWGPGSVVQIFKASDARSRDFLAARQVPSICAVSRKMRCGCAVAGGRFAANSAVRSVRTGRSAGPSLQRAQSRRRKCKRRAAGTARSC